MIPGAGEWRRGGRQALGQPAAGTERDTASEPRPCPGHSGRNTSVDSMWRAPGRTSPPPGRENSSHTSTLDAALVEDGVERTLQPKEEASRRHAAALQRRSWEGAGRGHGPP
jgi:hypothetical protein